MKYQHIELKRHLQGISIITLNRPEKRNALNIKLMDELCSAIKTCEEAGERVVVIEAQGDVFSSGLDLNEAADPSLIEATAAHIARLLTTFVHTPLVTIAAVQGDAFAGGAGLIAACDLTVLSKTARIGFPEVRRGLVAALVSSVLSSQISGRHMRELLMTGEAIGAEEALRIGIVNRICEIRDVQPVALKLAETILQGGPDAVRLTKRLIGDLTGQTFDHEIQHALALHHAVRHSGEAIDGVAAFLEKRDPFWISNPT